MLKIKKKPFFLTLFTLVITFLIALPLFFSYFSGYFLKSYSKKILGEEISYESLKFENGKIIAKNIMASSDFFNIKVDEVFFKIKLNIFRFEITSDLMLIRPHIVLKNKNQISFSDHFWKNKKRLIGSKINIKEGSLELFENNQVTKAFFSLEQKDFADTFFFKVGFDEKLEKRINLQIKKENGAIFALFDFIKTPTKDITNFVSYFNELDVKKMEGELNGNLSLKIDETCNALFDLTFLNLVFEESLTNKTFGAQKFTIKGDSYTKASKSTFAKKFPLKIRAEIEKGFLSSDVSLLEDINGSIFYNPELGPNVSIKAIVSGNTEKKECLLESRGYFNSKFCNWIDLDFSFSKERDSGVFLKLFEEKKDELLMQVKVDVDNEYLAFLHKILPEKCFSKFNILEGDLRLDGSVEIIKDKPKKVVLENFLAKNIKCSVNNYSISSKEISLSLEFDCKDIESTLSSSLSIVNGNVFFGKNALVDIKANVHLVKGFFEPSFINFSYNDLKTSAKIDGNISELVSNIEVKGPTKNILKNSSDQLLSVFSFKRKKEGGYFSGIIQLLDDKRKEENVVFGLNLKDLNFQDFKNSISSMWIRGENFTLEKWSGLFKNINLKGKINFSAFLQNEKFCLQFQAKDFEYKTDDFTVEIEKIGSFEDVFFEKKDFASFTYEKGFWSFDASPLNGSYKMANNLKFDCKSVKISNYKGVALFDVPEAISENINLAGKVFYDFINNKLDIVTKSKGKVSDLNRFMAYFGLSFPLMEGTFESYDNGFYFSKILKENEPFELKTNLAFKDLSYNICDNIDLCKAKMKLEFDAKEDRLELNDVEGTLKINNKSYSLNCPLFFKKNKKLEYDLRIAKPTLDLIRIKGDANFQKEKIVFNFDPKSHFLGEKIQASLELNEKFKIVSFLTEMNIDVDKAIALLDIDIKQKMSGIVKCKVAFEKNLKLEILGQDLFFKDKKIKSLFINGEKEGERFLIKELSLNDLKGSFFLEKKEKILKIQDLKIAQGGSLIEAEGTFDSDKIDLNLKNLKLDLEQSKDFIKDFIQSDFLKNQVLLQGKGWVSLWFKEPLKIEADLDLTSSKFCLNGVWIENNGELNLCLSNDGLNVSGLDLIFSSKDLDLSLLKSKFKYVSYDLKDKKWLLKGGYLYLPISLLDYFQSTKSSFKQLLYVAQNWLKIEKDLDLELDVEYENDNFKSFSKEASVYINGKKREVKDLCIKINKSSCNLDFKYLHENVYHETSHIFDFASFSGKLILGNESDPLSVYWSCDESGIIINKILGDYSGVSVDMYLNDKQDKDAYSLFGSVKVDISKALFLLPKDVQEKLKMLKMAKGYEAGGNLTLLKSKPKFKSFEGKIIGKDFELFNLKLKTFFANIKMWPDILEVKEFKISDLAGVFYIPKIDFGKVDDCWFFSIPKVEAYEIRPSLLQRMDNEGGEIKPLVIKNFVLSKLKGKLNDPSSITGEGSFSFINSFKRGHSVFEIPSEVLGRIVGLDSELLVPVCGDVFYEIKNNKCIFTKIKDVYSENGRSQFFLIGFPYMDFNGNLNIEIKMKQFVLFKITDKFVISIKGTVNKPELNLKKKKLFSD